jgi:Domain of unknown function (DUF4387)
MTLPDGSSPPTIESVASMVRSKNAGPFQITIDVFFRDPADYRAFKENNGLTPDDVARLYHIDRADVLGLYYWDAASAIKVTLRRAASAGSPGDNDCYGAQQHAPLLGVPVPTATAPPLSKTVPRHGQR